MFENLDIRISIHALREEGDLWVSIQITVNSISIHALREEGDRRAHLFAIPRYDFYPRPPRGGRPNEPGFAPLYDEISIHALREEGDHRSV